MSGVRVVKGHGTGNDFVVLPDLDGRIDPSPALVRALCDRHAGVGADGVLRVVRSENDPHAKQFAADAPFFMDYRNADGSVAEMCGNGVRVFVRYLRREGLVGERTAVATRGGVRTVELTPAGQIRVEMGAATILDVHPRVSVSAQIVDTPGVAVRVPNPHVVVTLADGQTLGALDLASAPHVDPPFPEGQNVEFVVRAGKRHLVMRVHERGVGETQSCGTGICAAVAAAGATYGSSWRVDVPGGTTEVQRLRDGTMSLTGPAVLVGDIELDPAWLAAAGGYSPRPRRHIM